MCTPEHSKSGVVQTFRVRDTRLEHIFFRSHAEKGEGTPVSAVNVGYHFTCWVWSSQLVEKSPMLQPAPIIRDRLNFGFCLGTRPGYAAQVHHILVRACHGRQSLAVGRRFFHRGVRGVLGWDGCLVFWWGVVFGDGRRLVNDIRG